jgi:hypothetical protein
MTTLGMIIVVAGLITAIMLDKKRSLDFNGKIVELKIRLEQCASYEESMDIYMTAKNLYQLPLKAHQEYELQRLIKNAKATILKLRSTL